MLIDLWAFHTFTVSFPGHCAFLIVNMVYIDIRRDMTVKEEQRIAGNVGFYLKC
jgi:hypothetical protein